MGSYLESYISIHVDIPNHIADNPVDWLCEIVCPVVSVRDDSIDMDELRDAAEAKNPESGTTRIDLFYENFAPTIAWDEDDEVVFAAMTDKIKEPLEKAGVTGTVNLYGYYTDNGPDVSAFVNLKDSPGSKSA